MGSWNPICSQKFLTGHNGALDKSSAFCQIQGKQRDGLLCINNTYYIIICFFKNYIRILICYSTVTRGLTDIHIHTTLEALHI